MNILFAGLLYHPDDVLTVTNASRTGLQNQINSYQWALIEGLRANLADGESLAILNALPVGVFPLQYRKLLLPTRTKTGNFYEIGCVNLPWLKQRGRARRARLEMERWIGAGSENRMILLYTLYLPYLEAAAAVKRRHPDVSVSVVVTDLPNELGLSSGRKGLLKRAEYARGRRSMALAQSMDGFVLLTAPMAEALRVQAAPWMVLEGLVSESATVESSIPLPDDPRPAVLYTGTLNRELGVGELIEAFRSIKQAQLWLCGRGDLEAEARQAAKHCDNIRYFGFVPQPVALALQTKAAALVNPRTAQGAFTRYSFPSKTLEYMRSGKPVLCCKLEGIPAEYDSYLRYISPQTAQGIHTAVLALLSLPLSEREAIGARAKGFALIKKNSRAQGGRLIQFLRTVQAAGEPSGPR